MKSQIDSGYIGNEVKWIEFFKDIIQINKNQNILEYLDAQSAENMISVINNILNNHQNKRNFYLNQVSEYPFNIPQSLRDIWLSGCIDIFEVIMSYINGFPIQKISKSNGLKYYKNFLYPKNVFKYKDSPKIKDFPLDTSYKEFLEEKFAYTDIHEYFEYPNDEFSSLPAYSKETLLDSFVIAEGDGLEVDGGIVLMYSDINFQPSEHEVALLSLSESSVRRYQSLAELLLINVINPLFFDTEAHSRQDLIKVNSSYKILLKP